MRRRTRCADPDRHLRCCFLIGIAPPPTPALFPYPTLFRSRPGGLSGRLTGPPGADVPWPHASPRRTLVRRGFSSYRRGLRMVYRILADAVVLVHAAFVAFVVLGGFLAWRWRWVVWLHVPCALWGVAIEYAG